MAERDYINPMDVVNLPDSPPPPRTNSKQTGRPMKSGHVDKAEMRQRLRYAAKLIIEGRSQSFIKQFFHQHFQVSYRQTSRYIRMAKEQLCSEISDSQIIALKAQSYAWYMEQIQSDDVPMPQRIRCRELADRLLGFYQPHLNAKRGFGSSPDGDKDEERKRLRELSDDQFQEIDRLYKELADREAQILEGGTDRREGDGGGARQAKPA